MKSLSASLLSFLLLTACAGGSGGTAGGSSSSSSSAESSSAIASVIVIDSPASNALVTSPLAVTGQARGTWYFEASFPVRLLDDSGNEIAAGHADAQGDWMTEDFVPFTVTLPFTTTAARGTLVLQKDNPSGLPENDDSVSIPVRF